MTWRSLSSALETVLPGTVLPRGASAASLDALEKTIGRALPPAFRRAWSEHDGINVTAFRILDFMNAQQIASEWRDLRDYDGSGEDEDAVAVGPVRALWTSPAWIPVASRRASTSYWS
jgi:cell wall assembly regulator SMI1